MTMHERVHLELQLEMGARVQLDLSHHSSAITHHLRCTQ